MNTSVIIGIAVAALVIAWLAWSFSWTARQSLLGTWVAALPDGAHVIMQFEGKPAGGLYKQLTKRDGADLREFGHWTIRFLRLRMIIMATDVKEHERFGVDTEYWVTYNNNNQMTINGPDRPKWIFQRTAAGVKVDFDEQKAGASQSRWSDAGWRIVFAFEHARSAALIARLSQ